MSPTVRQPISSNPAAHTGDKTGCTMRSLVAAILFNTACASQPSHGELVEADVIVPREGAKALAAKFSMGAGDLRVRGGDCELVQAKMRYDSARSVPKVDYAVDDHGFGTLSVREEEGARGRDAEWTVCVTRDVPLELTVDLGAGDSKLQLAGVQLRSLALDIGAGNADVDLRGAILAGSTVSIDGGAGNLALVLPTDVGVRVHVDKGVGNIAVHGLERRDNALVNAQWGKSDRSVDVRIDLGAGEVDVSTG
jgi:hypothetical protein